MKKVMFGLIVLFIAALSLTCVSGSDMEKEKAAVKKVIEDAHVNGFYPKLDEEAVKKGYHKDCDFISYSFIGIVKRSMDARLNFIKKNFPEPDERGVAHRFLSLTVADRIAGAVMEAHIAGRRELTTHLTLYKLKDGWKIVNEVIYWHGFDVPKDRKAVNLDPARYNALTGRYVTDRGLGFAVFKTGKRLFIQMQAPGHPELELFPQSETVYFNKGINVTVTFSGEAPPEQLVFRTGPTGRWDITARRMKPKVAVFSSRRKDFKISEVVGEPFGSKESALEKYGSNLPGDLEIVPASPKGMAKGWFVVKVVPVIGTKDLETVSRERDGNGNPAVGFSLKSEAAEKLKAYTSANIGKQLAIMLDNRVLSAPKIAGVISKRGMVMGRFTTEEVDELVMLLKIAINEN
ncbi:MAG: hypothetical protein GY950_32430 [bacterium]|nr:hypothetical protein [bacterium]